MSKAIVQFVEMVRQAAASSGYPLYCQVCGKQTRHIILPDQGKYECYQCPLCNTIQKVAVR